MLTFDIDTAAIEAEIDAIASRAEKAIRPAAQAGAQVYYNAIKQATPVSGKGHWFHGTSFKTNGTKYWFESGSLKNAVYQVYSKTSSSKSNAEYQVAWNHRKVPYGFMVAYGTSRGTKPNNFVQAGADSVEAQAKAAMLNKFQELIDDGRG